MFTYSKLSKHMKSIMVAGAVALGGLTATAGTASADHERYEHNERRGHVGFSIGFGGPRFHGDRYFGERRLRHRRACRPGKAIRKARRKGIRRAHIIRVGRRGVLVGGRKRGDRVVIGFANRRGCPVRFIDHR